MKTLDLAQGSPEWKAHRATHFNASDAPAMMGFSKYKTRTQLMHELKTGLSADVDAATQRRFDSGHRFEALARPLGELIIGEDLYPVVGTEGELSASFDGLTMDESIGFEHKTLNDALRAAMVPDCTGADLPMEYQIQMEQQCMVSGASRILFMASKWADDETLIEERHCWYESNQHLADDIAAGWAQFAADLAVYVPAEKAAAPVAQAIEALPALVIRVEGRVLSSNLDAYREVALARIEAVKTKLETDQDFADAEATVKAFKEGAANLKQAKLAAQAEAQSIDEVFRAVDYIVDLLDEKRKELDKLVTAEKERRRGDIVAEGVTALRNHINGLNERLGKAYMPAIAADFGGAIKGKKNIDSMRDAVSVVLANAKIEASATADRIAANIKHLEAEAAEHSSLFPDLGTIVLKQQDDFAALVQFRVADFKAKEEKRKAEEAARLAVVETPAAAPAVAPAAAPAVIVMPVRAATTPAVAPTTAPTLSLGKLGTRLGFNLTADFLRSIGFEPAGRERAAVLYYEADFAHICAALVAHIESVQSKQAA